MKARDAAYVAGLRRAVAVVDMWHPTGGHPETLMLVQATLRRIKEQLNREAADHIEVCQGQKARGPKI